MGYTGLATLELIWFLKTSSFPTAFQVKIIGTDTRKEKMCSIFPCNGEFTVFLWFPFVSFCISASFVFSKGLLHRSQKQRAESVDCWETLFRLRRPAREGPTLYWVLQETIGTLSESIVPAEWEVLVPRCSSTAAKGNLFQHKPGARGEEAKGLRKIPGKPSYSVLLFSKWRPVVLPWVEREGLSSPSHFYERFLRFLRVGPKFTLSFNQSTLAPSMADMEVFLLANWSSEWRFLTSFAFRVTMACGTGWIFSFSNDFSFAFTAFAIPLLVKLSSIASLFQNGGWRAQLLSWLLKTQMKCTFTFAVSASDLHDLP